MNLLSPQMLSLIAFLVLLQGLSTVALADAVCRAVGKPSLWPVVWGCTWRSAPYLLLMAALLCLPPAWSFVLAALAWIVGRTTA